MHISSNYSLFLSNFYLVLVAFGFTTPLYLHMFPRPHFSPQILTDSSHRSANLSTLRVRWGSTSTLILLLAGMACMRVRRVGGHGGIFGGGMRELLDHVL
jgi:hypothetical protein